MKTTSPVYYEQKPLVGLEPIMVGVKCIECGEFKNEDDFRLSGDKRRGRCIDCERAYNRKRHAKLNYPPRTEPKKCHKCRRMLPANRFSPNKSIPDGLHSRCKDCAAAYTRERYARSNNPRSTEAKKCSGECGRTLPASMFGTNKSARDGLKQYCKDCVSAQEKSLRESKNYAPTKKDTVCLKCRRTLPPEMFAPRPDKPNGLVSHCKDCINERYTESDIPRSDEPKVCTNCERKLPADKFISHKGKKDGLQSHCEECRSEYKKAHYADVVALGVLPTTEPKMCRNCKIVLAADKFGKHPEYDGGRKNTCRLCDFNRVNNTDITWESVDKASEKQGERCFLCDADSPGGQGDWHIDHDHTTKKFRSLLCMSCNMDVGRIEKLKGTSKRLDVMFKYIGWPVPCRTCECEHVSVIVTTA